MLIDARDKFLDRMAQTVYDANKKEGLLKGALRVAHLPTPMRILVHKKVAEIGVRNGTRT